MANTDTSVKDVKPTGASSGAESAKGNAGDTPTAARVEAQAGDPYRPDSGNDYSLSIEPEDTGEATIANLFQAVPLEHEGSGAAQADGAGDGGNGIGGGDAGAGGLGKGRGDGQGDTLMPDGATEVVETADGGPNDDGGLGDGEVPDARGLDAGLPQFDLGGDGISAAGSQIGDGTSGGVAPDDDDDGGDDGGENSDIGPVADSDTTVNEVSEFATGGEYTGVTAFADDPDVTDIVSYEITGGDDRFEIDPDTGEITVKSGSSFDAETEQSVEVEVTATSSDGSTSTGTFTITIGDENEDPIGPVTDSDTTSNEVSEFATGGEYSGVTAFADDPDVTDVVSYEITGGDDRFEIDPDTGEITVKPGSSFDAETEQSVDVEVTAISTDGSTSTGTFTITIGDENEDPIGPVTDSDTTSNEVSEFATGGEYSGVTAFADDPDVTDVVSYEITGGDDRFEIDPDTGEITVKPGSSFDAETEQSVDVEVTATSTDGSTSTGTFTITIGDENEDPIGPVTDSDTTSNEVSEFATGGEYSGVTAFADDPDVTDVVSYEITGGDDRFEIDPDTGEITVKPGSSFDAETEQSVDVEVTATSTDGSTSTGTFTITIGDENEDPIGPVTDSDTTSNEVSEFATGGEYSGVTAFADDPDVTDVVSYEITGGDDRFEIDPDTGEITVKPGSSFDAETEQSVDVEVTATSTDGSTSTGTFTITIGDENEDPIGPVTDSDTTSNEVSEFATGGEYSGVTAFADDPDVTDVVSYEITGGDDRFEIDPDTGEITVKPGSSFDAETEQSVDVEVTATSTDGSTSTGTFTITIGDENEDPIGPVTDSDTTSNEVSEFATGGEYSGVTAFADDPDVTDVVSYEITGGDDRFEIDPDTGEITVKPGSSFDAETEQSVDVEVTATSTDGSTSTGTFTITIGDENEDPIGPVTDSDTTSNEVSEFATGGEYSGVTAFADDPDVTDVVSYEITGGDDRFEIDPDTGEITVKPGSSFDAETEQSVDVEVTATSTDGSTSTGTFTITIGDENEDPIGPVTDSDTTSNEVSEFATGGEYSGVTAFADDPDVTDVVSYEITGGDDRFEIDPDTGVITVKAGSSFDHETEPSVDVEVTATSTDGSTSTGTFSIDITDGNEPPDLVVCLEDGQFVVNGSFEQFEGTLSGTDPKGYYENPTSIEGWSYQDVDVQQSARWGTGTSDGDHRLDLSANQNGMASQEIEGMLEGQVYTFSFDSAPRGDVGETVAEVYWNGELIDTIDPAEAGAGWNTYTYNIVGGSGDGTDTLTFVEVGGKNASFGTFIDNVSIVSDNRIAVVEEFYGAEIAPLQVFDPDVGDTHTFSVSDDRFEVVVSDGKYVLKLKDDQAFDYETETQVTVDVTVTDSGGLSDTETVVIDVLDIDENLGPIGPVTDSDNALNAVAENGTGGEYVGVTAFAEDPDVTDTVTYSITDDRFEIDPDTGVITVKDGVSFDHETMPTVDLEVTATSSDGSSSTGTFTVNITDVNEAPDLDFDPELGPGCSVTLTFVEEYAGYSNSLGVFYMDGNGNPIGGEIVWVNQNELTPGDTATVYLEGVEAAEVGYFLIPDGADYNTLASGDEVTFQKDGDGNWQAVLNGTPLVGKDANVFFSGDGSLNPNGYDYTVESGITIGFEDIAGGGDEDFDDLVFDQTTQETDATAAVYEEEFGAEVGGLSVFDPDVGDTHTFTVSDDRFEVVAQNGEYVLKLKDDQKLDYETETQVTVDVTVTDSGGLTDTETIVIDVIDIDENTAPVGPVSDVDNDTNFVQENSAGGTVVGVTAFASDPDASDSVTYSITDDRFEIDPDTGVITVADGAVIDREATAFIDIEVTATSTDGSTSTGTFRVNIGDEDEYDIGPVSDSDTTLNSVAENGAGGEYVGITAFAEDPDATDSVTYSITDDRFEIDPDTGVLTVKDGVSFDHEATPTVDVEVTATSTDGSTSTGTFTVNITDVNEAPDLDFDPELGPGTAVTLTFVEEYAGYSNSLGVFYMDGNGNPIGGEIVWVNQNELTPGDTATVYLEGVEAAEVGYFLIPDGADYNTLASGDEVTFQKDGDGNWQAVLNGTPLVGKDANVFFSGDGSLNPDGYDYTVESGITIGFEDIAGGGDEDFDDLVFDQTTQETNATAAVYEEEFGAEVGGLSVFDPDVGDTHTFTVSDDRFEVVAQNGEYVLKLKDDQKLDYETETQVTVDVTVTDSGGLTDTETIVIDVIDIDENTAPVGPVSDVDNDTNFVQENSAGGTVVGVTAFASDPDASDSVTYSITDDRFEIDPDTGVITVADGAVIDREATAFIDIEVTATSTDGSTSTGTFRVNIGDEDEYDIGPVSDSDTTLNSVAENGAGGEYVGITAFAEDPDATDSVTYSITDDRFEIDPDTGVLTVKDGVSFDHEATPTVDVEVTATSTDGSSSTGTFTVNITDVNEAPDLDFDPELGPGCSVTLTFVEEYAGYSNSLGVFYMDGNGNPIGGEIVWVNQNELTPGDTATVYLEGVEAAEVGYFLIPDGADYNTLASGDEVTFQKDGDGNWQAVLNGTPLVGKDANVFFSGDGSLNPNGYDYTVESGITIGFEDIAGGGDEDFDDLVFDQTTQETNATAAVYEEELGAEVGTLSVFDPDVGDTHTFTVSDDRFEVVAQNGEYVLKLKDDQALDYETETQVTVEVTATDSGGLSDTETIVIDVIDVEPEGPVDNNAPIGPVSDTDTAQNLVAATAAAGMVVGLTAFAQDADAGDTVTYEIDDDRFDIDADTGVVTVADGATLIAGQTLNVTVTATSSDGTQSSAVFPIDVTSGGDDNSPPDLIVGAAIYEPPKSGGHYDDHHDDHHGHIKDGDTGTHDHDDDDEKPHGHTDDEGGFYVPENEAGVELVELSVVDPDVGDTHTFTVSDERFEVVSDGQNYLLKLKDDAAVDYETEQSITLDVTATDSGGLSDTETITLDVLDAKDKALCEYGTRGDDTMVGSDYGDTLVGRSGNDILIGQGGADHLYGGSGDDVIRGGTGNDHMVGGDGSDLFAYMLGDGNDTIAGGAGGNWIDIVDLANAADGTALGEYGTDWSITMTEGSIEQVDALGGEITLSQDAGGYIELADGGRVDFSDLEGIQY
ncbi:cadherin domain-containing protein [Labrenzia sp. VG12]|uniref:cadherin domain-containing protein n=1 Tax=Labrenzia sp. VG12 TaxID=2021862 RepID=UPI0012FD25C3|nr:cadherin domain-containing protein [Labrenzia sp. VG12]